MYEDYLMLSKMLNFTIVINKDLEDACVPVGTPMPGTIDPWRRVKTPSTGESDFWNLYKMKIDAVGGSNIGSHEVHKIAAISAPTFYQNGANIVSVEPLKTYTWYTILKPFKWYVWIMILVTVPLSGGVLYLLRKYSQIPDKEPKLKDAMWDVVVILFWNGSVRIPRPNAAIIILLSSYMLATKVLVSEYFSYYTLLCAIPDHITPPINTNEQLWNSDLTWIGGRMKKHYVEHFSSIENIEERIRHLTFAEMEEEGKTAIELMISNPDKYVYFERAGEVDWNICNFDIDLKGRKMYYSKETIGDYYTFMYFRKNSIYIEAFNSKILRLHETGIILMNQRKFANAAKHSRCYEKKEITVDMITLVNVKYAFTFILLGYLVSILCFIKELVKGIQINVEVVENVPRITITYLHEINI